VDTQKVEQAVAKESRKGYDLLVVGVEKMRNPDGTFTANVDHAAAGFNGPLALTIAGDRADLIAAERFNILVPVNGTEPSRRGAEIAFALSPAGESRVTALHVAERIRTRARTARRGRSQKRAEQALLEDISALGRRYGFNDIRTAVHTKDAPDEAILAEAERIGADLIVIGAARRTGDALYLGQTVANVLARWTGAIVLVAS
jgi:nucleotide-binding universal stress UspA family protein